MTELTLPAGWRENPTLAAQVRDTLRAARSARQERNRERLTFPAPGDLAKALDPNTVQTPALEIIDHALVEVEAGRENRVIISMPPQEGKSERTTHYGALWMLHRNPHLRVGIVSYGERIARRLSMKIRNDIVVFDGKQGTLDLDMYLQRDSKAAGEWQLAYPQRGSMYATGIGGALTGQPLDVLFIDDPVKDRQSAESAHQSGMAWDWWLTVARPRLAPGAPVIVIQTRWHELDLAGRLIAKQQADEAAGVSPDSVDYDRWTVINIPAQADHDPEKGEVDPLGRAPGEYMESARGRTRAQWEATKLASGAWTWNALYQGRPSPGAGNVLLKQWWGWYPARLWTIEGGSTYRIEGAFDEAFTSWDMTFKDTKGTDFVVGQVWMRRGARAYLLDQVRARMSFTETVAAFKTLAARWPDVRVHLVEAKANGPAVISSLGKEIAGIVPIEVSDSKLARAAAIAPFVEATNVWLPAPEISVFTAADNNPEHLVDEAAAFPNAAHDDQVDALSQALHRMFIYGMGAAAWLEWITKRVEGQQTTLVAPAEPESPEVVHIEIPVPGPAGPFSYACTCGEVSAGTPDDPSTFAEHMAHVERLAAGDEALERLGAAIRATPELTIAQQRREARSRQIRPNT